MVVISDGGDEISCHTPAELKKLLQETGVEVYGIGTFNLYGARLTARTNSLRLDEVLTSTGGRAISAYSEDDFVRAAARINHELHTQYSDAVIPSAVEEPAVPGAGPAGFSAPQN